MGKKLLIFLFSLFATFPCLAQSTLIVGSKEKYKSITDALTTAKDGDRIIVKSGRYVCHNVIITKSIQLIGENYPVLDAKEKDEVITILASNVIIKGFTVKNTNKGSVKDYAGIRVFKANNVQVLNNKLQNTFFGIYLSDANNCQIKGNVLTGTGHPTRSGNGIHLWKCNNAIIENNTVKKHRDGIYFEFVKQSIIKKNHSELNNRYGLHFMFSDDDQYIGNTFTQNGSGVAVMYTKRIKMLNNVFENNWGNSSYGLLLKDISDSHIEHNIFRKNTSAIYFEGSSRIKVLNNDFTQNGWAIRLLANCENDHFEGNNFIGNTFDLTTNGTHNQNTFQFNYWDKYEGYDLNKDKTGDVPYRPVSLYAQIIEKMPYAVTLLRSFIVNLLDKAEKAIPSITPETLMDQKPLLKPIAR